jgi:hypothetical protein
VRERASDERIYGRRMELHPRCREGGRAMNKWAIKAVFSNEKGEENFTFYEEKTYLTKRGALRAINGDYGDLLAQDATIDCAISEDLKDFWLDDFDVYKVEKE